MSKLKDRRAKLQIKVQILDFALRLSLLHFDI